MSETEMPLSGRITRGVVRIGGTVRRPISCDRSLVHALLVHLEAEGFEGAPRFLGVDAHNREILSYLPGEVPSDLGPFADAQLAAAGILLRRFHDATVGFARLRYPASEIIGHNDWGPPNAVFREGLPYGLIDFDTLAAGTRLWDLGYTAFAWLDLGNPDYDGSEQLRRLAILADGYGAATCPVAAIARHAVARQTALASSGSAQGQTEMAQWAAAAAAWTAANMIQRLGGRVGGVP